MISVERRRDRRQKLVFLIFLVIKKRHVSLIFIFLTEKKPEINSSAERENSVTR